MAKLIVKSVQGQPDEVIELKPGVTRFGRGASNDLVFSDPEVSDFHCEILLDNEFVFVKDLNSTNGTFIDGEAVRESALYSGQVLRIGPVEMSLDAPAIRLALPELPKPENPDVAAAPAQLLDGYPACLNHAVRHAIWECPHCTRVYCDECIRKLRRVGGVHLKLCPACSNPCQLTSWAEMMRKKKKGFFGTLVSKLTDSIKRTTKQISR
jgi:hypothetical protein